MVPQSIDFRCEWTRRLPLRTDTTKTICSAKAGHKNVPYDQTDAIHVHPTPSVAAIILSRHFTAKYSRSSSALDIDVRWDTWWDLHNCTFSSRLRRKAFTFEMGPRVSSMSVSSLEGYSCSIGQWKLNILCIKAKRHPNPLLSARSYPHPLYERRPSC